MQPTLTPKLAPYLLVNDAESFVHFLENALGGRLTFQMRRPDGKLGHTEVCIVDSVVMLSESQNRTFPAMLHLYVPSVDESYNRALGSGS